MILPIFKGMAAARGIVAATKVRAEFSSFLPIAELAILAVAVREAVGGLTGSQKMKSP